MKILQEHTLVLNYELSCLDIIKKSDYGIVHPYLRKDLFVEEKPLELKKIVELSILKFEYDIDREGALLEMAKKKLRPSNLRELLTTAFFDPDLHRHFRVVALGSVLEMKEENLKKFAPCLFREFNSRRKIGVIGLDKIFDCRCAFLATGMEE